MHKGREVFKCFIFSNQNTKYLWKVIFQTFISSNLSKNPNRKIFANSSSFEIKLSCKKYHVTVQQSFELYFLFLVLESFWLKITFSSFNIPMQQHQVYSWVILCQINSWFVIQMWMLIQFQNWRDVI